MKVKIGKQTTSLGKEVVAAHMANLLASRAILTGESDDLKQSFTEYKKICQLFLDSNKRFVYKFGDEKWLEPFLKFQANQNEILKQEVFFRFSDGSLWTVLVSDIAKIRAMQDKNFDSDNAVLDPVELTEWAQDKLTWDQVKVFSRLRVLPLDFHGVYTVEWPDVKKKVIKYKIE